MPFSRLMQCKQPKCALSNVMVHSKKCVRASTRKGARRLASKVKVMQFDYRERNCCVPYAAGGVARLKLVVERPAPFDGDYAARSDRKYEVPNKKLSVGAARSG